MNEFGFWQRWGLELDDKQFANAFLVLGVIAASSIGRVQSFDGNNLREKLLEALQRAREKGHLLPWRFPRRTQRTQIGDNVVRLSDLEPRQVADLWSDLLYPSVVALSIQVLSFPITESVSPWFRMLFEADPAVEAAYIVYNAARVYPHLKWPFRIRYLGGNNGEAIVKSTSLKWPTKKLTTSVKIDRDNANCDVLVFSGSSRQLLRELLDLPGRQKSNLIIVRGRIDDDTTSVKQRLAALSSETSASGYVFLHPDIPDELFSDSLNRFIENLSHNQHMDIAISEAFTQSQKTDPAIFMSRYLATFKIENFLVKMTSRLMALPPTSRVEVKPDVFDLMGIPEDRIKRAMSPPKARPVNIIKYAISTREEAPITVESGRIEPVRFARALRINRREVRFDREIEGATGIAEISTAVDRAESRAVDTQRQERFLQEQVIIKKNGKDIEERHCFHKGVPTLIRVRVGPPDKKWVHIPGCFRSN